MITKIRCTTCHKLRKLEFFYNWQAEVRTCKKCRTGHVRYETCDVCKKRKRTSKFYEGDEICKVCRNKKISSSRKKIEKEEKLSLSYKKCSMCKEVKLKKEFYKLEGGFDFHRRECKSCFKLKYIEKKEIKIRRLK